jgi:hypothetical protein
MNMNIFTQTSVPKNNYDEMKNKRNAGHYQLSINISRATTIEYFLTF